MKPINPGRNKYVDELEKRSKDSHVHYNHQLIGLEIADILGDRGHKSLYIKLAKKHSSSKLLSLAKSVAERETVKNRGAYFMTLLKESNQ